MKIRPILICILLTMIFVEDSFAGSVIRNGLEYLQPADFTNLSWNDVNAVCPGGVCDGMLNGVDVTGYTWANTDEYLSLTSSYGVPLPDTKEMNSTWAPRFLADFNPTYTFPPTLEGFALIVRGPPGCYLGVILCFHVLGINDDTGDFHLVGGISPNNRDTGSGHLFFRTAPPLPIPGLSFTGLVLLALGLCLIMVGYRPIKSDI